jgi:hypothetical protein
LASGNRNFRPKNPAADLQGDDRYPIDGRLLHLGIKLVYSGSGSGRIFATPAFLATNLHSDEDAVVAAIERLVKAKLAVREHDAWYPLPRQSSSGRIYDYKARFNRALKSDAIDLRYKIIWLGIERSNRDREIVLDEQALPRRLNASPRDIYRAIRANAAMGRLSAVSEESARYMVLAGDW